MSPKVENGGQEAGRGSGYVALTSVHERHRDDLAALLRLASSASVTPGVAE